MPGPLPMHPSSAGSLDAMLADRLAARRAQDLYRTLSPLHSPAGTRLQSGSADLLNFSSNDYLGLATEPAVCEAAARAARDCGAGSTGSRLICGSLAVHHELEASLAEFKGAEATLTFSSGYATALGTVPALVGVGDVVVLDKQIHASLIDAARLSGARIRVYPHGNMDRLEDILQRLTRQSAAPRRILLLTESLFSMDGDQAPLRDLVALKARYGAWLLVDEAHATGLFGQHRRGLLEARGVADRIEVQLGTLGKTLGAAGGFIAGSRLLIDYLVNHARTFLFSTAPVPAAAAAAIAAIACVRSSLGAQRNADLWQRIRQLRNLVPRLASPAHDTGETTDHAPMCAHPDLGSPILPLQLGSEARALRWARELREAGFFIPAIRYPTVSRGTARLRITLSARHTADEVERLAAALARIETGASAADRIPDV